MTDDRDEIETVELPREAVEAVIKELEAGMRQGEIAHSHDKIRSSTVMMAKAHKDAYGYLIEAHPDYTLNNRDES